MKPWLGFTVEDRTSLCEHLDAAPEAIMVLDASYRVLLVNHACELLTGYGRDVLVAKGIAALRAEDPTLYRSAWAGALRDGQWQGEMQLGRADGSAVPVWLGLTAVHDDSGRILHYLLVASSLSEIVQHQQRMMEYQRNGSLRGASLPARLRAWDVSRVILRHAVRTAQLLQMWNQLMGAGLPPIAADVSEVQRLSEREREIFLLIARGYENREIAQRLYVSVKTVESYKKRVMEKLGVTTRAEIVESALEAGLLSGRSNIVDI